jgi:hypothetical protein
VIVLEDKPQTLVARFMYGSLDIASLSGEKVRLLDTLMMAVIIQ